jgi:hypothetical protein
VRFLLVAGIMLVGGTRTVADTSGADNRRVDTPQRQVRWYVDRGLNVEVRRLGLLEEVAGTASELLLHVQAGFRLSVDGAAFAGDDQGSEPGGLRRAYIRVGGEFWPWRRPVKFYLEIGVINEAFSLDTSYLTFPALPHIGDLQVGSWTRCRRRSRGRSWKNPCRWTPSRLTPRAACFWQTEPRVKM